MYTVYRWTGLRCCASCCLAPDRTAMQRNFQCPPTIPGSYLQSLSLRSPSKKQSDLTCSPPSRHFITRPSAMTPAAQAKRDPVRERVTSKPRCADQAQKPPVSRNGITLVCGRMLKGNAHACEPQRLIHVRLVYVCTHTRVRGWMRVGWMCVMLGGCVLVVGCGCGSIHTHMVCV